MTFANRYTSTSASSETEELLEIWRTHDRYEWSEMTFDVIREILQERHVELPHKARPFTRHTN